MLSVSSQDGMPSFFVRHACRHILMRAYLIRLFSAYCQIVHQSQRSTVLACSNPESV